jgi:hypothetical protein
MMTVITPGLLLYQRLSNGTSPMTFGMVVLAIAFSASAPDPVNTVVACRIKK